MFGDLFILFLNVFYHEIYENKSMSCVLFMELQERLSSEECKENVCHLEWPILLLLELSNPLIFWGIT